MTKLTSRSIVHSQSPQRLDRLKSELALGLSYRALEQRIAFDAALAATVDKTESDPAHHTAPTEAAGVVKASSAALSFDDARRLSTALGAADKAAGVQTPAVGRVIVFIDGAVQDEGTIAAAAPDDAQIVILDRATDGVDQIARYLAGSYGVDAIHILTHGSEGNLYLGTADLNVGNMSTTYATDMAIIRSALAPNADILVYGCDFAKGADGDAAARELARLTGANVAASTDLTGAADLGGNWVLEDHIGTVDTKTIAAVDWNGELTTSVNNGRGALLSATGNKIYSIDIATGKAMLVTTVPSTVGGITVSNTINSFAVDQATGLIYYVDNATSATNVALFAYDYVNNQHILVSSDVRTLGITVNTIVGANSLSVTLQQGLGGAGATFANGHLFLGVEDNAASFTDSIYSLTMSADGKSAVSASRLNTSLPVVNDWGDLGYDPANNVLLSFVGANNTMIRIDPSTGATLSTVNLPTGSGFQGSQDQAGNVYSVGTSLMQINPTTGALIGSAVTITTDGTTALGGSNDAGGWTPPTAVVSGSVFLDANSNALKDTGETGIANVTVQLYTDVNNDGVINGADASIGTDTTDASGQYQFTGVLPGNYIVKVSDANGVISTHTYTTAGGNTNGGADVSIIGSAISGLNFGVADATPVLDLDTGSAGTSYTTTFTEKGAAVTIAKASATTITDTDDANMASATVVLTNKLAGDALSIGGIAVSNGSTGTINGLAYTVTDVAGVETITLTGSATKSVYQTTLDAITYASTSQNPASTDRTIDVTVSDGFLASNTAVSTIHVVPVDDAPAATITAASYSATEQTALTLKNTGLAISDIDAGSGNMTVTLSVGEGTLNVTAGGSGAVVTNSGTGSVTITGTVTQINALLASDATSSVSYIDNTDTPSASTSLTLLVNDNGNTGSGGPLSGSASKTINVTAIDDAPVNTRPASFTTLEDTSVKLNGLAIADVDANASTMTVTLSVASGTLTAATGGGVTVTGSGTGSLVLSGTLANINTYLATLASQPTYVPVTNANGSVTLTMTTNDNGNTGSGGPISDVDTSIITVTPVNDAPAGADKTITTNEDTAYTLAAADFGFTDIDGNSLLDVKITTLPTTGTLTDNDVAVTAGQIVSLADITSGKLVWTPAANANGNALSNFTFQVQDNGGTANGGVDLDQSPNTITFNVTAVNDPPAGADRTVSLLEDQSFTFAASDFGFTDVDGNAFSSVIITTLPPASDGVMKLSGVNVTAGQEIPVSQIANLTFAPAANVNGNGLGNFTFQVRDDSSVAYMNNMIVSGNTATGTSNGVAFTYTSSAPILTSSTLAGTFPASWNAAAVTPVVRNLQATHDTLSLSQPVDDLTLVFASIGSNGLGISVPIIFDRPVQVLWSSNVTIDNGTAQSTTQITGTEGLAIVRVLGVQSQVTFDYTVAENYANFAFGIAADLDPTPNNFNFNITPVNDAPAGADKTITTNEDTAYTLTQADFGFNDPLDTPANSLLDVKISTLPTTGTLTDNGAAVTAGQIVSLADITSGKLVWTPAANANGAPLSNFTFQVQDNGGTFNGGVDLDQSPNTITFNVTPVDDAPVEVVPAAQTTNANTNLTVSGLSVSDVDANGGTETVTLSVAHGTLSLASTTGLTFTTGTGTNDTSMTFTGTLAQINADIAGLVYKPASNYVGADTLTFTTNDNGNTGTGGPLSATKTVAITVADVPPTAVNDTDAAGLPFNVTKVNGTAITAGGASVAVTGGSVALDASDQLIFTPTAGTTGSPSFTYTIDDGHGGTSTATVSGTVNDIAPIVALSATSNYTNALSWMHDSFPYNGPTIGNSAVIGSAGAETAGPGLSLADVSFGTNLTGGTVADYTSAVANGSYVQYTFTTAAGMPPNMTIANIGNANMTLPSAFKVAYVISPDNFATSTLLAKDFQAGIANSGASVSVAAAPYELAPNQTYTVRVYVYAATAYPLGWDNFTLSFQQINLNTTRTYTEGGAGVSIANASASVSDADNTNLVSGAVTITNAQAGDQLLVNGSAAASGTLASGITYTDTGTTVTLSGSATTAQYLAAIQAITYKNTTQNPGSVSRIVDVTVNDGFLDSTAAVNTITVIPVDDAPVEVVPGAQTTNANTNLTVSGLSVSDVDANGGTETVTLSVAHGTLSLASTTGLTFTTGTGTNDTSMTFTGTLAQINADIAGLVYKPTTNYVGADTLTFTTNDNGNTGTGGPLSDTKTVAITVADVPPVAVNDTFTTAHDTPVTIAVEVNDTDAAGLPFNVTKVNGTAITAGGASVAVTGGSVALNASNQLIFTPTAGTTGSSSFTYTIDDGHGGTSTATVSGTVSDVAPLVSLSSTGTSGITGAVQWYHDVPFNTANATIVNSSVIASAAPETVGSGMTRTITASYDVVGITATDFASAVASGSYIEQSFTTTAALPAGTVIWQLGEVSYANSVGYKVAYVISPDNFATATILQKDFQAATTGGSGGGLFVNNVNYPLAANQTYSLRVYFYAADPGTTIWDDLGVSTQQINLNNTASYTENGAPVSIAAPTASIKDIDDSNQESAVVTITNPVAGDRLLVNGSAAASGTVNGIAYTNSGTTLTLTGTAGIGSYVAAIEAIQFDSTSDNPTAADRIVTVTVNDGNLNSTTATSTITVTPVDDAPAATITAASYAATEQTALTLKNTGLSISDIDAGSGSMTVTLSVGEGTLNVTAGSSGATVSGSGSSSVTLTGTVAQINALLASDATSTVSYIDNTDTPSASTTLTLLVNDNGNTGTGGPLSGSATSTINVTAVDDAPVNTLPATFTTLEDTSVKLTGLSIADVDAGSGSMTVTLAVGSGTLTAATSGGVTVAGSGTGTLTLTGTVANIDTFLATAASRPNYVPVANANGSVTLTMTTSDNGNTGTGGPLTDVDTSTITITPVNDPPAGADKTITTNEDTTYFFTAADFGFTDADGNSLQAVKITSLLSQGQTRYNGLPISVGQLIPVAGINSGLFKWTPGTNASGNAYANFTFQVQDDGVTANGGVDTDPTPNRITFNVTPVNDAPAGANTTVTTNEDTAYTFTTADFVLTDVNDTPANGLLSVKVTTLPGGGVLTDNGVAVTAGQFIPVADIASGQLVWTPFQNANGVAMASFTFQVQDDGGTANGGVDLDQSPNTMTINVTPVNDPPNVALNAANLVVNGSFESGSTGWFNNSGYELATTGYGVGSAADGTWFTEIEGGPLSPITTQAYYEQTIATVPGQTYIFQVQGATRAGTGPGDMLGLSVNGTQIGNFVTGATWGTFGATFTATSATTTIRISSNGAVGLTHAPPGDGDGVLIDDVRVMAVNTTVAYTENGAGVSISPGGSSVVDIDSTNMASATITLNGPQTGDQLLVGGSAAASGTLASGIGWTRTDSLVTLTGAFTKAQYAAAIQQVQFSSTSDDPTIGGTNASRTISVVITDDGGLTSNTAVTTVNITPVNDAPAGADKTITTLEDTAYTLAVADFGFTDPAENNSLLDVKITTLPSNGTLTDNGVAVTAGQFVSLADITSGKLVWTPAANANGTALSAFTFQVQDNGGTANGGVDLDQSPNTITFNVTPVNDPPAGADKAITTLEDTAVTLAAADFGFTDPLDSPANSLLDVKITTLPTTGTLTDNGVAVTAGQVVSLADITSGKLVWTPAANANGAALSNFTFQVQDNGGTANGGVDLDQSPNTITFNVTAVNDAPIATSDAALVSENGPVVTGSVTFNDSDVDGDPLTVTGATQGTTTIVPGVAAILSGGGVLTLDTDGSYTFDPGTAYNGLKAGDTATETVTYAVSDGNGGTSTAILVVTVQGANDAPVVIDPSNPGSPANPTQAADPTHLVPVVATTDGATPAPLDTAQYVADPDGEPLVFTATGLPPGMAIDPASGVISGTLPYDASQAGPFTVLVTATDPHGATATIPVTYTVANPPPVAADDATTASENGPPATGNVLGNDHDTAPDGDPLTVTGATQGTTTIVPGVAAILSGGGVLTLDTDGSYTFDPGTAYNGLKAGDTATETVTYAVSDGNGGTSTAILVVTVQGANDAPVVIDPSNPGSPANPTQAADPTHLVPVVATTDGATPAPLDTAQYVADPDGEPLVFTATGLPPGMAIDPASGVISGTLPYDASQAGPFTVLVTATDPHGATATIPVTYTVANPPPVAADDATTASENGPPATGNVLGNDHDTAPDGDPLTVTGATQGTTTIVPGVAAILSGGGVLTLDTDGSYTFDPGTAYNGLKAGDTATETVTYAVSDGNGGTSTAILVVTVQGANDAPVVIDPSNPGSPANPTQAADPTHLVPVVATTDGATPAPLDTAQYVADPDGEPLVFTATGLPPGMAIDPASGVISGTLPYDASQAGPFTVLVTATDPHGATATIPVTYTVANPPPVAADDAATASENGPPATGNVLGNDHDTAPDGDPLTVTGATQGTTTIVPGVAAILSGGGVLTLDTDGSYTFDPGTAYNGLKAGDTATETVTYAVSDGNGGTSTAILVVTVQGANDAPVVIDPSNPGSPANPTQAADPTHLVPVVATTDGATPAPLDTAQYVADPDGEPLVFTATGLPPGMAIDPASGVISGTLPYDASQAGPFTVLVTATDPHGATATIPVTYTVANPPPVAADDAATALETGQSVSISVLANDRDGAGDGDPLTVIAAVAQHGTVVIRPNGEIVYTSNAGYDGNDLITYTISDGNGGTSTARVPVTVKALVVPLANEIDKNLPQKMSELQQKIDVPIVVLDTVNQLDRDRTINVRGIILDTVSDIERTLSELFGSARSHEFGNPELHGLQSFSLKLLSTDAQINVKIETFLRDRRLTIQLGMDISSALQNSLSEWKLRRTDGRPLPEWLELAGKDILMGDRPADDEVLDLRIVGVLRDGRTVEHDVRINVITGEIRPLEIGRSGAAIPRPFWDQLGSCLTVDDNNVRQLLQSLLGAAEHAG